MLPHFFSSACFHAPVPVGKLVDSHSPPSHNFTFSRNSTLHLQRKKQVGENYRNLLLKLCSRLPAAACRGNRLALCTLIGAQLEAICYSLRLPYKSFTQLKFNSLTCDNGRGKEGKGKVALFWTQNCLSLPHLRAPWRNWQLRGSKHL